MSADLEHLFPGLAADGYALSSPESTAYNCVAWAVGESHRWWQPGIYWPASPGNDLAALIGLFASLGYHPCDDHDLEAGYEKFALYADDLGEWTRGPAARGRLVDEQAGTIRGHPPPHATTRWSATPMVRSGPS